MSTTDSNSIIPSANGLLRVVMEASGVALCSFRKNHDMCENSGCFPAIALLNIDQCAQSFRALGVDTISVARLTSNRWISMVILFYERIGTMHSNQSRKIMLDKHGDEAKKLGKIFKVIAACARHLSGKIRAACSSPLAVSKQFTDEYNSELNIAQEILDNAQSQLQEKQDALEAAKDKRDDYKTALKASAAAIILGPIGLALGFGISGSGFAAAQKAVESAEAAKKQAEEDIRNAQREFDIAQGDDRAKKIAQVTATLVKVLQYMEKVTDEIAIFWTGQSDNFRTQGMNMIAQEADLPEDYLADVYGPRDIKFWRQSKQDLDKYIEIMTRIMDLYKYANRALPVPTKKFQVSELSFSMHVPYGVDINSIMDD